jgi:hypothetical protein
VAERHIEDDCPHCSPCHGGPERCSWGVRLGTDVDGDGQPMYLVVQPADGSHVAPADARWLWELIRGCLPAGAAAPVDPVWLRSIPPMPVRHAGVVLDQATAATAGGEVKQIMELVFEACFHELRCGELAGQWKTALSSAEARKSEEIKTRIRTEVRRLAAEAQQMREVVDAARELLTEHSPTGEPLGTETNVSAAHASLRYAISRLDQEEAGP